MQLCRPGVFSSKGTLTFDFGKLSKRISQRAQVSITNNTISIINSFPYSSFIIRKIGYIELLRASHGTSVER